MPQFVDSAEYSFFFKKKERTLRKLVISSPKTRAITSTPSTDPTGYSEYSSSPLEMTTFPCQCSPGWLHGGCVHLVHLRRGPDVG